MKNKILLTSFASALILLWLIWVTNADFWNFTKGNNDSYRTVIDKLIDGETLTVEDKVVLNEIKTKRAEREIYKAEREAKRVEIEPIMEKYRNGETLTSEEQKKLDEFRSEWRWNMWKFWRWFGNARWFWWGCPFHD